VDDLDLVTLLGHRMTELHRQEAEGIVHRSRMTTLHALCSTQDENHRLIRANRQLQQEQTRAMELLRTLVDRSEAFRRLVVHLRDAWEPADPAERPLKNSLKPLLDAKKQEVANDSDFARERDADIEQRVRPVRNTRSQKS
jgi:hypothetical protein